jgi:protoheme IX farnesyltransferase
MPIVKGVINTKGQIMVYTFLFVITTLLLSIFGYAGIVYFIVMLVFGAYWLRLARAGLNTSHNVAWSKQMFRTALLGLVLFSLMISVESVLP